MRYTRTQVTRLMYEKGIVTVFYHHDIEICKSILSCCYKAGIRVFEFTNRGEFALEIYKELYKYVCEHHKDLILGVGTIMDASSASNYIQYGANFIISPILDKDIATVANRRKVVWIPGCETLNEIRQAETLGAEIVKLFPASIAGGAQMIKMLKGPMPWSSVMATGGIDIELSNLNQWFDAGVHCVGIGSQIFNEDNRRVYDFDLIEMKLGTVVKYIQDLKRVNPY